jgi:hypothetical protein
MKVFRPMTFLAALLPRRGTRRIPGDPADMGTAFGLESVTVVRPESAGKGPGGAETAAPENHWERRANGRSRR